MRIPHIPPAREPPDELKIAFGKVRNIILAWKIVTPLLILSFLLYFRYSMIGNVLLAIYAVFSALAYLWLAKKFPGCL